VRPHLGIEGKFFSLHIDKLHLLSLKVKMRICILKEEVALNGKLVDKLISEPQEMKLKRVLTIRCIFQILNNGSGFRIKPPLRVSEPWDIDVVKRK